MLGQNALKSFVHARLRITYAHCAKGVSMISTTYGEESALFDSPLSIPILNGHFNSHFN